MVWILGGGHSKRREWRVPRSGGGHALAVLAKDSERGLRWAGAGGTQFYKGHVSPGTSTAFLL